MAKFLRFHSVVVKNEYKVIRGCGFRSVIYLSSILYLAFLCIGFSHSAMICRAKLAGNPFSNWVNIEINKRTRDSTESLIFDLSDTLLRKKYCIKNLFFSKEFGTSFLDRTGKCSGLPLPKAMTLDPGSTIIDDLLSKSNVIRVFTPENVFQSEPFGFVVTATLLEKLGFHPDSVSCLSYRLYAGKFVPVPILAVVRELPNNADVVCTDAFYRMQMHNYPDDSVFSRLFVDTRDLALVARLSNVIRMKAGIGDEAPVYDSAKGFRKSLNVLYFSNRYSGTPQLFKDNLKLLYRLKEFQHIHFGTYFDVKKEDKSHRTKGNTQDYSEFNFDFLAVEFSRLDRIKEFSENIKERYHISLNMETVTQ
ncbi:MAG: hypothetical protein WCO44_16180 [Bacteroidota bacterium]